MEAWGYATGRVRAGRAVAQPAQHGGQGGLALVTGGAGIGKSRLVAATLEQVRGGGSPAEDDPAVLHGALDGVRMGYGECLPDLLMPPLWPISRAVSSAAARPRRSPSSRSSA